MVKVVGVIQREDKENRPFVLLELQGELELVQSQKSLNFYGTVRRCTLPCTLDLKTAQSFVGKEIAGSIVRVECTPYEYVMPESGEITTLTYRWSYVPDEQTSSFVATKETVLA
ncbi:MAG: hypothetical protein ACTHMD_09525 [Flavisolibacter sp.]